MYWDWAFAWSTVPILLRGLLITVEATIIGSVIALVVGLPVAMLRRSGSVVVRGIAKAYIDLVRGTPLLVQLFFAFYALPNYGVELSPLTTGVLVLGINYSAYTAEVYRAGIEGVPQGQWEAARALSLPVGHTWRHVVLPQAVPRVVPALGNYVNQMFKDSALLGAIMVPELLQDAKTIGGLTYRFLEPMTIAGLMFLAVSIPVALLVRVLERRLREGGSTTSGKAVRIGATG